MSATTWGVWTGEGGELGNGMDERTARMAAQAWANKRGESVFLSCDGSGAEEEIEPAEDAPPRCQCGKATGVRCDYDGAELVTVEWMPEYLRSSHVAAGNSGIWPHNGAERLDVSPECADMLEDEWTTRVSQ